MTISFRFFIRIFYLITFRKKMDVFDTCVSKHWVTPMDLDLNFHMNSGKFLTCMDIGRSELAIRLGFHKVMVKEGLMGVAAAINIIYLRSLNPFKKFELHTKILAWDDRWLYIQQEFFDGKLLAATTVVKFTCKKGRNTFKPQDLIERVRGEKVESPQMPEYLLELIQGEKKMVARARDYNRAVKEKS